MKNSNILIALLISVLAVSCGKDYLEPDPSSAISGETFYTDESQLEAAVIGMYDGLQGVNALEDSGSDLLHSLQVEFYLTEMRSDNTRTKSSEGEAAQFENYTLQPTNGIVADYYASMYNVIFRANIVLDNLGVASAQAAAKFEAEAKF
ncbi:MAG: RagB/SusD family nutrient uptake outer membrane protein, partial [Marinirhabdus sp.]